MVLQNIEIFYLTLVSEKREKNEFNLSKIIFVDVWVKLKFGITVIGLDGRQPNKRGWGQC